jgi:hypothetical protein
MATETHTTLPQKLFAQLAKALQDAAKGIRDPKTAEKACKDMDRMRQELRQNVGRFDVAVDLIRETRDE